MFSSNALNALLVMMNYKTIQGILLVHENIPRSLIIPGERHHESILQLYKIVSPRARVTDNNLIVEISLPLLYNEEFKLYKILSVPTRHIGKLTRIVPSSEW